MDAESSATSYGLTTSTSQVPPTEPSAASIGSQGELVWLGAEAKREARGNGAKTGTEPKATSSKFSASASAPTSTGTVSATKTTAFSTTTSQNPNSSSSAAVKQCSFHGRNAVDTIAKTGDENREGWDDDAKDLVKAVQASNATEALQQAQGIISVASDPDHQFVVDGSVVTDMKLFSNCLTGPVAQKNAAMGGAYQALDSAASSDGSVPLVFAGVAAAAAVVWPALSGP